MPVQSGALSFPVVDGPPGPALAQWTAVACCPACGSSADAPRAVLPDRNYVFGTERVAVPRQGIAVIGCRECGLHYKATVPAPAYLKEVYARQAPAKWAGPHDFSAEVATLRRLHGSASCDVLDIGAAGGALLGALVRHGVRGRRSALDVMRYPGVGPRLAGELIEGFLDEPLPAWSREPYDLVTLFDVLEHLYQPQVAFANLRQLVKPGGRLLIETGNSESGWPRRFGIGEWWYVRLLEHHVFWSRRSLARIAADYGFEIVEWREVRHKSRRRVLYPGLGGDLLKTGLYWIARDYYSAIANLFGKQGNQPWSPFARDHFQACLLRA